MNRRPRRHDKAHLDFIRGLPCIVCGDDTTTEAAHIRMADARAGKRYVGMGEKPDDMYVVPLCGKHHREQHKLRESSFWDKIEIDPIRAALGLHSISGDDEAARRIIAAHVR